MALPGQVGGVVCLPAALVLAVQDKALGGEQTWPGTAVAGTGARIPAGPSAGGAGSPSPASSGSTALWAAALPPGPPGGGDEEVHIVALQLPPEGASLTLSLSVLPNPFSEGRPTSVVPPQTPSLGRA